MTTDVDCGHTTTTTHSDRELDCEQIHKKEEKQKNKYYYYYCWQRFEFTAIAQTRPNFLAKFAHSTALSVSAPLKKSVSFFSLLRDTTFKLQHG